MSDRGVKIWIGAAVGSLGALFTAAALVGVRGDIQNANVALVLVLWVLLGAVTGGRASAVISAFVAAISFDFFQTKPYNSLKISDGNDVLTTVLLLAVGLAIGEIAIRAQRVHAQRDDQRLQLQRMHRIAGMAAGGEGVEDLLLAVTAELIETLELQNAWFERPPFEAGLRRLEHSGVIESREHRYANGEFELPREGVELPVVAAGRTVGRFVLIPTPGVGVSKERRMSAVALADQVGAALARPAA
ncbi:MAG: PAS domain-containing sensor histidine kinase [Acidimicrobiia bacterium]|nr:PAS domain-containing sensor histidine kinase [Acidimicrobiia bacterium]MBV9041909.1 PAS domain-containing sensor histidine kinase [Acidimicrobiia bacterium]